MAMLGPSGATALLAGALRYALGVCAQVKPAELGSPTPCVQWDVRALLWHLGESMADLEAGLRSGSLDDPGREARLLGDVEADPLGVLRDRAAGLLCACYDGGP